MDCGDVFYSLAPTDKCQRCSGNMPDLTAQQVKEQAAITKANAALKSKGQTVDLKALTSDGTSQILEVQPAKKTGRKPKDDTNATG